MTRRVTTTLVATIVLSVIWLVAALGGPGPLVVEQKGKSTSDVRTVADSGVKFTASTKRLRPLIKRDVEVPRGEHRLATIALSAVCSHTGGSPEDYTTAEALTRHGDERQFALGGAGHDLVLCSDLGDGANYRTAVSHTWTTMVDGGVHHVVVRFASVGEGVARLQNVVLVVTLSRHPCSCP